jgi:uncharacterized protein YceK
VKSVIILAYTVLLSGCGSIKTTKKEVEYFESGQVKKSCIEESTDTRVKFSDGKAFSLINLK